MAPAGTESAGFRIIGIVPHPEFELKKGRNGRIGVLANDALNARRAQHVLQRSEFGAVFGRENSFHPSFAVAAWPKSALPIPGFMQLRVVHPALTRQYFARNLSYL